MNFRFIPGLANFQGISRESARRDVAAGLSVAAVALPVGLAYSAMMGVPPVAGLWAAIAGMLAYAFFGSSRTLIVGPDTATCTLIAATLTGMALTTPEDRLLGATAVFVGAVWEDSSGYPDCRPEFYRAYEEAIRLGTRPETRIRVVTPVIGMSKADIVRTGLALGAPFDKTWSCYQDEEAACGVCESCRLRLAGFQGAGAADPIRYREPAAT